MYLENMLGEHMGILGEQTRLTDEHGTALHVGDLVLIFSDGISLGTYFICKQKTMYSDEPYRVSPAGMHNAVYATDTEQVILGDYVLHLQRSWEHVHEHESCGSIRVRREKHV